MLRRFPKQHRLAGRYQVATGATIALVAAPLIVGVPANANEEDTLFESAQYALGLSPEDSTTLDPGVTATITGDNAVIALGDFELAVSAPENNESDTTVLPNGVRVMSLLEEGASSATFTLDLPSGASLIADGGGFNIVVDTGETNITLGQVEAPWAVDAKGKELPTSYSWSNGVLTQTVDTAGAAYPIVADPAVTVGVGAEGFGFYWNMRGYQAKAIAATAVSVVLGALAGGCAGATKIPRIGGIVSSICGFVGAPTLKNVFAGIKRIMANASVSNNGCYQIKVPGGRALRKTKASNCD